MATRVVATAYGGPEVLTLVEEPVGEPGPRQVLVEVRAAGTNPYDYKVYSGIYGEDPSQLPIHLGAEASGVVRSVGEGAVGETGPINSGDEVIAYPVAGGYASDLVVGAASVVSKPSTLSFEEAAGLMVTGTTAAHALTAIGVEAGDTVLIHGAAGGVGFMAVQLALNAGARVIGTASESGHDRLREVGAEPVSHGDGLLERVRAIAPDGIDAAIDTVGADEALDVSVVVVSDRARIVTIVSFERAMELGVKAIGFGPGGDPGTEIRSAARLELVRQAEEGKLHVPIARTYPLREVADAHRELSAGHAHGKIILVPERALVR